MAATSSTLPKVQWLYRNSVRLRFCREYSQRGREDGGWLRSMFVDKMEDRKDAHRKDAHRKDAHSNLLAKTETSSLYKMQFHNVKPECLQAYNDLEVEVQSRLSLDEDFPCELVGSWNTWYGDQDQAVPLIRSMESRIMLPTQSSPLQ